MFLEDKEKVVTHMYNYIERTIPGLVLKENDGYRNIHNILLKYLDKPDKNLNDNIVEDILMYTKIGVNLTNETKKYFNDPEVIMFSLLNGWYPSFEIMYKSSVNYVPVPYNFEALGEEELRKQYEKTKKYIPGDVHSAKDISIVFADKNSLIEILKDNIQLIPQTTKNTFNEKLKRLQLELKTNIENEISIRKKEIFKEAILKYIIT